MTWLLDLVVATPDLTLDEIRQKLFKTHGRRRAEWSLVQRCEPWERIPAARPLRVIGKIVNTALAMLDAEFDKLYAFEGRAPRSRRRAASGGADPDPLLDPVGAPNLSRRASSSGIRTIRRWASRKIARLTERPTAPVVRRKAQGIPTGQAS
jgi:hypothetical protein